MTTRILNAECAILEAAAEVLADSGTIGEEEHLRALQPERRRSRAARSRELRRRAPGLVKACKCTKTRRCDTHAAAHVDAYEARRAARTIEQADREDRATARAALDLRAFLDSLSIPV